MIDDRRDSPPSLTLNLLLLVHFCFLNFYFVFFFLVQGAGEEEPWPNRKKMKNFFHFLFSLTLQSRQCLVKSNSKKPLKTR